jgi:hypothetical protein
MQILKTMSLSVVAALLAASYARGETSVSVLKSVAAAAGDANYDNNREPLLPNALIKLPIGAVKPRGWMLETLSRQRSGLAGNLPAISAWLDKSDNAWLSKDGRGKWGWEEVPYWLRGSIRLGQQLGDRKLTQESETWLHAVLRSQRADGHFGPLRVFGDDDSPDLWANMLMLSCLQSYYEYSNDERVIVLMSAYARFVTSIPEDKLLTHFWQYYRGGDLLTNLYWLYNRTGDKSLLALAEKVHHRTANWHQRRELPNWHSVNVAQAFGEPATYYLQSHSPDDLRAAYDNFGVVRDRFGQAPGGMFAADENARIGYDDPRQAIETCAVVEQMSSDEQLLAISGDVAWADHLECVAFNTLPATVMSDYRALRYLTSPNLSTSDRHDHAPGVENIGPMFVMSPLSHRCCLHNHSQAWPRFVEYMWMATPDNGLCAALHGPSTVTAKVGENVPVVIEATTRYPFEEQIIFKVQVPRAVSFPLYLRIPQWCKRSTVLVNGAFAADNITSERFVRINRKWESGDQVVLNLPMDIVVRRWEKNHNCVSIDRGPLTYSIKIAEQPKPVDPLETALQDSQWQEPFDHAKWPAFEVLPSSPWNYGLVLNKDAPAASFSVHQEAWPEDNYPFSINTVPVHLTCTGRLIPEWGLDLTGLCAPLQDSPVYSDSPDVELTLIPMGAALLRLSSIPEVQNDRNLRRWRAASEAERRFHASASHCYSHDKVEAIADGFEPCASNDRGISRHTFLPRSGGVEWLQASFDSPRTLGEIWVYWCDDSSRYDHAPTGPYESVVVQSKCRVPKAWRLLYSDGGDWKPVETKGPYATDVNQYNKVSFVPVTTRKLKIEVDQASDASAGVLEWRIFEFKTDIQR